MIFLNYTINTTNVYNNDNKDMTRRRQDYFLDIIWTSVILLMLA